MATICRSSKRSARVILTAAAAAAISAQAQAADPCDALTFNGRVCRIAIKHKGFCSGGAWTPMTYSQKYPYYYDKYAAYLLGGGAFLPFTEESCKNPDATLGHGIARGGFGTTGAGRGSGG